MEKKVEKEMGKMEEGEEKRGKEKEGEGMGGTGNSDGVEESADNGGDLRSLCNFGCHFPLHNIEPIDEPRMRPDEEEVQVEENVDEEVVAEEVEEVEVMVDGVEEKNEDGRRWR